MKRPPLNAFPMYSLLGAYYTKNAPGRRHLVGLTTAPRPFVRLALRTIRWTAGQAGWRTSHFRSMSVRPTCAGRRDDDGRFGEHRYECGDRRANESWRTVEGAEWAETRQGGDGGRWG